MEEMAGSSSRAEVERLKELREKLEAVQPASPADAIVKLLEEAAECLFQIEQSPAPPVRNAIEPCLMALAKNVLLKHQDDNVRVLLATCLCEVARIAAQDVPYSIDTLTDILRLIVSMFNGLSDINSPSFGRRVAILETVSKYPSCLSVLDLECNDLIIEMFVTFLRVISDNHAPTVHKSMESIMIFTIDKSVDRRKHFLNVVLSALERKQTVHSDAACKLAQNTVEALSNRLLDSRVTKNSGNAISSNETSESRSLKGSLKKQKLSDISDLAKCSTHLHDYYVNLVGCRIKVWWPLDQQFYKGAVQSYDSEKRMHKILYDDGDVEMLTLAEEIWRVINDDGPVKKRQKHGHREMTQTHCRSKPTGTSRWQNEAEQHKRFTRSSLSKGKTEALVPSDNNIRKAARGKRSVEVSSVDDVNCVDLPKDNAQAESDDDVNLDKEYKEAMSSGEKRGAKLESHEHTAATEKDHNGCGSKSIWEDSDNETLGSWLKRMAMAKRK